MHYLNTSIKIQCECQAVCVTMSLTVGLTLHLPLHGSALLPQSVTCDDLHSQIESFVFNIVGAYTM